MDVKKITAALEKLDKAIDAKRQASVPEEMLPTDKRNLLDAFEPFFTEFFSLFRAANSAERKEFHFAAIYGLVLLHSAQVKEKLVCYQSNRLLFA